MASALSRAADQARSDEAPPAGAGPAPPRRQRESEFEMRPETDRDYVAMAPLADAGFDAAPGHFRPEALRWLYEEAFTDGTTVLALWSGGSKVGQVALVHHSLVVTGRTEPAIALMDLFILKAQRSLASIVTLYRAVEEHCRKNRVRFILAMPNDKAAGVNSRFLKLAEAARLDIRVGVAGLPLPWHSVTSYDVSKLDPAQGSEILDSYCGTQGDGLLWTGSRLWARLQKPDARYAIHAGRDALLVSAPRTQGRLPHTMLCGFFARSGTKPSRGAVSALVSAACRHHRRPVFVYAGINEAVPLPGLLLPERYRPSPMILQLRDFATEGTRLALSRFEALDFDFA
jgi:hypothetical protein